MKMMTIWMVVKLKMTQIKKKRMVKRRKKRKLPRINRVELNSIKIL
jgi:hypothetical protein